MNRILAVAALSAALPISRPASAEPPSACQGPLHPAGVVTCAVALSPQVAEARHRLAAVAGRRVAAGVWLPSNPVVAATLAQRRRADGPAVLNWAVTLSQELEVAGQRGARLAVADAEAAGEARRLAIAEQEVAADALATLFEALAAHEALQFAEQLLASGRVLAGVAEARASEALLSGVEADVARAEAVRLGLLRAEASRRYAERSATLALLLGRDDQGLTLPAFASVSLPPPQTTDRAGLEAQALRLRGELGAAEMERQVLERRLALQKRERVPSVTVSAFAERDEIDDHIMGLGLSIPLPLPGPVGRSRAGEIAETLARVRAAGSSLELLRRQVRLDVARAFAAYTARQEARAAFPGDLLGRARADLVALREALVSRQLPLRDAVAWQRSLVELLAADIETRLARELAVIELSRVVGLPLVATAGSQP